MKLFVALFFGAIGVVLLSVLSAVGGLAGGGVSLLILSVVGNVLISSLIGGAVAALAFHLVCKAADTFFAKTAAGESVPGEPAVVPPSITRDKKYLWGSLSYFASTVLAVNLAAAIFSDPTWSILFTIIGGGALGILGVAAVIGLKLWIPNFKVKKSQ
ncbi:MAG: hypothetical protein IT343_22340 [Candidatus Melainabacteria bacterium]|nr:hypothetical protein [Candidatus Melainabacteria bacterium]